ncbi:MAG: hypothetical protein KatS3mg077_2986 [Candidatus Binatia bacterium]|nr:MAG: hypothetical protein KatS3mg077_2986 [Candidatus Binatia bacterium]
MDRRAIRFNTRRLVFASPVLSRECGARRCFAPQASWLLAWLVSIAAALVSSGSVARAQPEIAVSSTVAQPGWSVDLNVSLRKNGLDVRGVGVHIFFDPRYTEIEQREPGVPECWVSFEGNQRGHFALWPPGCWQWEETCDTLRAIIVSLDGQGGPLPDGTIFTCRMQVSPAAPPGQYELANDFADATNPDGDLLVPRKVSGAVIVTSPSGSGGCAIVRSGPAWEFLGAGAILFLSGLRLRARRLVERASRGVRGAKARSIGLFLFAMLPSAGLCQSGATILDLSGTLWGDDGDPKRWTGTVAIFPNGGISGSVRIQHQSEGAEEVFNLSASLSTRRILQGHIRSPEGKLVGHVRGEIASGAWPRASIGGLWWRANGGGIRWEVGEMRVRQKKVPPEVIADLVAGRARRLAVIVDQHALRHAARRRTANRTEKAWLPPSEHALLARELKALNESIARELREHGATVPPRLDGAPSFIVIVPNLDVMQKILQHPLVREVVIPLGDRWLSVEPLLSESLPLIGQPLVASRLRGGRLLP